MKRNDVSDSAERNKVELRLQIELDRTPFKKRVTQFENDSDAAKIMKRRLRIDLWIHYCHATRQIRFGLMMIECNHIHAALREISDLDHRRRAAIDRDQKLRMMLLKAAIHTFTAQSVAFLHSQRQEQVRRGAIGT